jgi:VanZ family protein
MSYLSAVGVWSVRLSRLCRPTHSKRCYYVDRPAYNEVVIAACRKDKREDTLLRKIAVYHLPAIAYAALIVGLSSMTNVHLPKVQFVELDKVIHFCEYAIFTWLVYRSTSHLHTRVGVEEATFLSLGFVALFAFGDEFYQSFVPGRQSDAADFLTDVAAAMVTVTVVRLFHRRAQGIIA